MQREGSTADDSVGKTAIMGCGITSKRLEGGRRMPVCVGPFEPNRHRRRLAVLAIDSGSVGKWARPWSVAVQGHC